MTSRKPLRRKLLGTNDFITNPIFEIYTFLEAVSSSWKWSVVESTWLQSSEASLQGNQRVSHNHHASKSKNIWCEPEWMKNSEYWLRNICSSLLNRLGVKKCLFLLDSLRSGYAKKWIAPMSLHIAMCACSFWMSIRRLIKSIGHWYREFTLPQKSAFAVMENDAATTRNPTWVS